MTEEPLTDEVDAFRALLDAFRATGEAVDRARRARNAAAARLVKKMTLAELAELAGVSRERVRQWAAEGQEENR